MLSTAFRALMRPAPQPSGHCAAIDVAVEVRADFISSTVAPGFASNMSAITPATCGVDCDVPLNIENMELDAGTVLPVSMVEMIDPPGAITVTGGP